MKGCILGPSFLAAYLLLPVSAARADNWPQWRGPTSDGVSNETNIPAEWSETKNVAWKLHAARHGRVHARRLGRPHLPHQRGRHGHRRCCASAPTARSCGSGSSAPAAASVRGDEGNGASPSPEHRRQARLGLRRHRRPGLLRLRRQGGLEVQRSRSATAGSASSSASTPRRCSHGDRLYLQLIHAGGALGHRRGQGHRQGGLEGRARRATATAENEHSYASPCRVAATARTPTWSPTATTTPSPTASSDGKEIWRARRAEPARSSYNPTLRFVASPVATPDLIVVPTAKNGPVVGVKPDAKGLVDAGQQGRAVAAAEEHAGRALAAGRTTGWSTCAARTACLICLDAKTGKEHYYAQRHARGPLPGLAGVRRRQGLPDRPRRRRHRRQGRAEVRDAGENKLPDQISASPAVADGRIYLRGFKDLYAIGPTK